MLYILVVCFSIYLIYLLYSKQSQQPTEEFAINYEPTEPDNIHLRDFNRNECVSKSVCYDEEGDKIDKYRNDFFGFQTRINNSSHLNDPVDNINITGLENPDLVGKNISEIYDGLVNSNDYKTYN